MSNLTNQVLRAIADHDRSGCEFPIASVRVSARDRRRLPFRIGGVPIVVDPTVESPEFYVRCARDGTDPDVSVMDPGPGHAVAPPGTRVRARDGRLERRID